MDIFTLLLILGCLNPYTSALTWVSLNQFDCKNGSINLGNYGQTHVEPTSMVSVLNCEVTLTVNRTDRLMFFFEKVNIDGSCSDRWLELHDGNSKRSPFIGSEKFCGYWKPSDVYTTNGRYLKLLFHGNWSVNHTEFALWVTSYHTGTCRSGEFKCENDRCIDSNLRCFGENPCGDNSDCKYFRLSKEAIIGIVVGGCVLAVIVVAVILSCLQKRDTRSRRQKKSLLTAQKNLVAASQNKSAYGYDQPIPKDMEPLSYPRVLEPTSENLATTLKVEND